MKQFSRLLGMGVVCLVMLTLVVGVAGAQDGDVIVIAWEQEPPTLYPMTNMAFSVWLENFYARRAWDWDKDLQIYPIMVEEIPTAENGMVTTNDEGNTVVTYKLREGIVWSDGEPITSADCELWHRLYSDRTTSANIPRGTYPDVVESFEIVDDHTFTLTYNRPWPDYQVDGWNYCNYPAHILNPILEAEGTIDDAPYFTGQGVVGYGPYTFDDWVVGDTMTLHANPNWDGEKAGFETVIIKQIPDQSQMVSAMETGEIDVAFNYADNLVPEYQAIAGVSVFGDPGVYGDAIWVNHSDTAHPALQDINVRRAIAYAVDRPAMAEGLVGPGIEIPKSWYSSLFWPEDLPDPIPYDPDMANQLLDEAGWVDTNESGTRDKDGVELILRFFTTTRQVRIDYQVLIQEYLSAVGIGTQLFPVPAGVLFDSYSNRGIVNSRDFDLALYALSASPLSPNTDPPSFYCSGIAGPDNPDGQNTTGFCNEEYERLDALVQTTLDPEERMGYAHDAIRIFTENTHWIGLYLRVTWYSVNGERVDVASVEPNTGLLSDNYFRGIELWQPAG
jgi:peptide/nickel transport system substrate-binding protein